MIDAPAAASSTTSPEEERPVGVARRVLARLAAACLFLVAAMGAMVATWDMRAQATNGLLDAADAATGAARLHALDFAERELQGRAVTGDLAVAAARLAMTQEPPRYHEAERLLEEALRHAPAKADVWADLAAVRAGRAGVLDAAAQEALQASFLAAAFGPSNVQRQRLAFAVTHWDALEPSAQRAALRHVDALSIDAADAVWLDTFMAQAPPGPGREAVRAARARTDGRF